MSEGDIFATCQRDNRGQSAPDFLVGMSVFLLTIGFVFAFVPGMFDPFETDTGPNMVSADRAAAYLAESALVEDVDAPGRLNESCTAEFFYADGDTDGCAFDADASDLNDALGVSDTAAVNVTIETQDGFRSVDGAHGSVDAQAGRAPPPTGDVVVAKRVVTVDGDEGTLYVRVW